MPNDFINYILEKKGIKIDYDDFKEELKNQMAIHQCPYSIKDSKKRQGTSYIIYKCRIKDCPSHFQVKFRDERIFECSGEWMHNHPMNKRYIESHFCIITSEKNKRSMNYVLKVLLHFL